MVMGYESVMVILDASTSRDISWSAIREALHRLPLNPGDKLTLFGVVHLVSNTLGYKSKVNFNLKSPTSAVEEELARKKEQFNENLELLKQTTLEKIQLEFELRAGPSRKVVAVEAAKSLEATWIILDREMKKEKKYFLKNLSCRISKMKSDNTIEDIRGATGMVENEVSPSKSPNSNDQVSYDEMIPGDSWEENYTSPKRSPGTQKSSIAREPNDFVNHDPPNEDGYGRPGPEMKDTSLAPLKEAGAKDSQCRNSKCSELDMISSQQKQQAGEIGIKSSKIEEEAVTSFVCSVCKNRRPKIACHIDFTYKELYEATGGFSSENFLSEGGFGCVFSGGLKNGLKIAVKQHKPASLQGEKEFKSEVHVLSKARHENLVMLLGSCSEGSHRLLVYEYVCNGSLDRHLSKDAPKLLTWEKRIKISLGAAKGLEYLHSQNIIHRDMRPNNILITHDYESLLGDFGLAIAPHDSSEDNVVGTLGYLAPEYAETGKVSTKTDVYSFGVILLQLVSGLSTTDEIPHGKSLIGWQENVLEEVAIHMSNVRERSTFGNFSSDQDKKVPLKLATILMHIARPLLKDKNYPDLIDRKIIDSHDFLQLFWMVRLIEKCLSNDPDQRFTMEKVVDTLNSIKDGNTTCIGDFSPISDSMISILDSFEEEEDEKTN